MKKKILYFAFGMFCVLLYFGISYLFTIGDLGELWTMLKNGEYTPWYTWPSLCLFRLLVYTLPALVVGLLVHLCCKDEKKPMLVGFQIQFTSFIIVKSLWYLLALDYKCNTDIFDKIDSFIVIGGLLLSVMYKEKSLFPVQFSERGQ